MTEEVHYCKCGCGQEIEFKKQYKWYGYPKYKWGHGNKGKKINPLLVKKGDKSYSYKSDIPHYHKKEDIRFCACGCGGQIIWKKSHIYTDVKYIRGHFPRTEEMNKKTSSHGKDHPMYGRKHTEKAKKSISEKNKGRPKSEKTRKKIGDGHRGKHYGGNWSEERRKKHSMFFKGKPSKRKGVPLPQVQGNKNPSWKGGTSFFPYCPEFNKSKREEIRNKYNRQCFLCGKHEKDNLTKNKKRHRLEVHHVDSDKQQGCNGKQFELIPLCIQCHRKTYFNKEYWNKYFSKMLLLYHCFKFFNSISFGI